MISLFNSKKRKKSYKKVALVLSGGGARGFGHIGVIEVLEERGYEITSIAGSSMGALVGCLHAMGELQNFKNWVTGMKKYQVIDLIDLTVPRRGIIKGDRVFKKMQNKFPTQNLEDLPIPVTVLATLLYANKPYVFEKGDVYASVRASISNPTVFTPVKLQDDLLVDGGILNNIPTQFVKRSKNDLLIAVDVNAFVPYDLPLSKKFKKPTYFGVINQAISLLIETNASHSLEKNPPDILMQLSKDACEIFDFFKAKRQIEYGRRCAEKAMDQFLA